MLGPTVATSEMWPCGPVAWGADLIKVIPWPHKPVESGCTRLCQTPHQPRSHMHSLSHCLTPLGVEY